VKAALYLRVSTKDQTVENQERELRALALRLNLDVATVYSETASGGKARTARPALDDMLVASGRRDFDALLIWSLDRLTREGIGATMRYMDRFRAAGVRVVSYRESWLDTGGVFGDLLLAIFAWMAQQERTRYVERVKAGQDRARAAGVHIGRRARDLDVGDVLRRREAGQPWRRIARAMKCPVKTLRRRVKAWQKPPDELCRTTSGQAPGSAPGEVVNQAATSATPSEPVP
jgi:DNA invertase Pin-like site-specific DNA recombinase